MAACPFCDESIHIAVFAKSEHCLAVYNRSPILRGHSMVIPREHYHTVLELPEEVYSDMMHFMRSVSGGLIKAFGASGINWTLQEGEDAGQTIEHLHFHLIPRKPKDLPEPGDWYPRLRENEVIDSDKRPTLSDKEMRHRVGELKPFFR
ncbi:MAG: HIT family protein [Bacteroidales bacterium]|nr:HIT family protein [Bacteroidales bacterium]MCF8334215.1 HIT family protein [Bacteroidales bacterium]